MTKITDVARSLLNEKKLKSVTIIYAKYVLESCMEQRVDMVVALINAVYLLQQDIIFDDTSWAVQY